MNLAADTSEQDRFWDYLEWPIRPSAQYLSWVRSTLGSLGGHDVIVLGATRELAVVAMELDAPRILMVDRDREALDRARRGMNPTRVDIVVSDWIEWLNRGDRTADTVMSDGILLFLDRPEHVELFDGIGSLLKRGGRYLGRDFVTGCLDAALERRERLIEAGPSRSSVSHLHLIHAFMAVDKDGIIDYEKLRQISVDWLRVLTFDWGLPGDHPYVQAVRDFTSADLILPERQAMRGVVSAEDLLSPIQRSCANVVTSCRELDGWMVRFVAHFDRREDSRS